MLPGDAFNIACGSVRALPALIAGCFSVTGCPRTVTALTEGRPATTLLRRVVILPGRDSHSSMPFPVDARVEGFAPWSSERKAHNSGDVNPFSVKNLLISAV